MTDPYLLLTPVLALAVLALARFVGCDRFFHLHRDESSFVESFVPGLPRTYPMDTFVGWAGMAILVGDQPLKVTKLGRIMLTASTTEHQVKLVERFGDTGGIDRGTVTIPPSAAVMESPDNPGFVYATLQSSFELLANTEYYVVSHEAAAAVGGDLWYDLDTTVITSDVAEVRSSVFTADNNPDVYQRLSGPGTTYGPVDFIYFIVEEPT
jgi:hypothetical protein